MASRDQAEPNPGSAPALRSRLGDSGLLQRARRLRANDRWVAALQLGPVCLFLGFFFVAPLAIFLLYSFWTTSGFDIVPEWTFSNYTGAVSDEVYRTLLRNTFVIAGITAVATVTIAYAVAHALRFHLRRWQEPLLLLIVVAMFSGYLVRIYAWRTLLGSEGIVNEALRALGAIEEPLSFLLFNRTAAIIVLVNFGLPLAILPIYAALQNVQQAEIEAARDLGCGPARAFRHVTLPRAWPGIFFAFALTFAISAGDYVVPQLVGGANGTMIGKVIADTFTVAFDWTRGAALAFLTLMCIAATILFVRVVGWRLVK